MSFNELLYQSPSVLKNTLKNKIQLSTLLSVKTGFLKDMHVTHSAHHNTGLEKEKLIELQKVEKAAIVAKRMDLNFV